MILIYILIIISAFCFYFKKVGKRTRTFKISVSFLIISSILAFFQIIDVKILEYLGIIY